MRVGNVFLSGIGVADTGLVSTAEAVSRGWWDAAERSASGLESVSLAGTVPAPDLAVQAGSRALEMSGRSATEGAAVLHTNVHPQGPDGWSAQHYVNRHTVNQPVTSVEVRNGCVGFFSALELSVCFLAVAAPRSAVLITAADNFGTPAVDRWRASKLFVLADGGGAVVLASGGGFARLLAVGAASDPWLEQRHRAGEQLFPPGLTAGRTLNFEERTRRFREQLAAGQVSGEGGGFGELLPAVAERTLREAGVAAGDIARVIHDGWNHDVLQVMLFDPLDIDEKLGIWEFTRTVGHAGPLDAIRGLEYAWRERVVSTGDNVLIITDAPGMEAACAVVQITAEP